MDHKPKCEMQKYKMKEENIGEICNDYWLDDEF